MTDIEQTRSFIKSWYNENNMPKHKVLSLFSGGGGLDIAFHDAGFDVVKMVEKDKLCVQTLSHNAQQNGLLSGSSAVCADVETYEPDLDCEVDFIIGGPPCQSFSAAGRRMAGVLGTSTSEGKLFQHYVRLLKKLRPKGFLFENVLGLLSAQQGSAWETMHDAFIEAGYQPFVRVLDAADYGVPQHRERVIVIGVRSGSFCFPAPTHGPRSTEERNYNTAEQSLLGVPTTTDDSILEPPNGKYGHLLKDIPPGLNYTFYTEKLGHPKPVFSWRSKFSDFLYKASPNTPTRTIKANGGPYSGPFHWDSRPFTIAELKRLQTFPDNYKVFGGRLAAFRQIGNAVPPQLARILALSIRNQIFGESIPLNINHLPLGDTTHQRRAKSNTVTHNQNLVEKLDRAKFNKPSKVISKQIRRVLTKNFDWQSEGEGHYFDIKINSKRRICTIQVTRYNSLPISDTQYTLILAPTIGYEWPLALKQVRLEASDTSPELFTACWKAFQEFLSDEAHLADLVQLSGYYYFPQQLTTILHTTTGVALPQWLEVVSCVVSGYGVGKILDIKALANFWNIEEANVLANLIHLRSIGYEVRSNGINPQIPTGQYLVPYSFPTLNQYSPHRRKSLEILTLS